MPGIWNTTYRVGPQNPEVARPMPYGLQFDPATGGVSMPGGNVYSQYQNQAGVRAGNSVPGGIPREPASLLTGQPTYQGFIPTYGPASGPIGSFPNQQVRDAASGLLTPGLVPDIARQSAEIAAGRGVAGSGAGASTAVRMSEQNYLQRLGLANTLLSGEAGRELPYQITPYQREWLDIQRLARTPAFTSRINTGGGGSGGYPYMGGGGGGVAAPPGLDLSGFAGAGANPFQPSPSQGVGAQVGGDPFANFDPNWGDLGGGSEIDQILADLGLSGPGGGGIGSSDFDMPDFAIPDFNDYESLWG